MAQVRLLDGKPLIVGGKVALSDECCCGGGPCDCILPAGACSHVICCEINFDQVEFDAGGASGSFIFAGTDANDLLYVWYDFDSEEWTVLLATLGFSMVTIPMAISSDTWYPVNVQFKTPECDDEGKCIAVKLCANGESTGWTNVNTISDFNFRRLFFGSYFSSASNHHSMRNIQFLSDQGHTPDCDGSGNGSWPDRIFPDNSFDGTVGAVTFPETGVVRVDSDDFNDAYAIWELPASDTTCYPLCDCGTPGPC